MFLDFRGGEFRGGDYSSNCRVRGKTAFGNVRKFDRRVSGLLHPLYVKNYRQESGERRDKPRDDRLSRKLETGDSKPRKIPKRPNNSGL